MGLNKRPRWTVIAAAAAVGTVAASGIAFMNTQQGDADMPETLTLRDAVSVASAEDSLDAERRPYRILDAPVLPGGLADGSFDSPFDDAGEVTTATPASGYADSADSPDDVATGAAQQVDASADSPDPVAPATAADSYDSPDAAAPTDQADDSWDNDAASVASADSPDDSF